MDCVAVGSNGCDGTIKGQKLWDYNEKINKSLNNDNIYGSVIIGHSNNTTSGISNPGVRMINNVLTIGGPDYELEVSKGKILLNGVDLLDRITKLEEFNEVLIKYFEASGLIKFFVFILINELGV